METASLVVDIRNIRCGNCKILVGDPLAERCPACGGAFDRVASNHVGLAECLEREWLAHRQDSPEPALVEVAGCLDQASVPPTDDL